MYVIEEYMYLKKIILAKCKVILDAGIAKAQPRNFKASLFYENLVSAIWLIFGPRDSIHSILCYKKSPRVGLSMEIPKT